MIKLTLLLSLMANLYSIQAKDSKIFPEFSFRHPTCVLKMLPPLKDQQYLLETYQNQSSKRKFKTQMIQKKKLIFRDDLYVTFQAKVIPGGIYKKCKATITIKKAQGRGISSKDRTLYHKSSIRSLPRITFQGKERCTRALRDAFISIPTCLKH